MILEPPSLKLSIIIAASNDFAALQKSLVSLRGQADTPDTEVIAVCNSDEQMPDELVKQFPAVQYVQLAGSTTVPELRSHGIGLARGEIIALIENYCTLSAQWCAAIKKAHESGHPVVGGSIENGAPDKSLNWAVYFYDYGRYMPPVSQGPAQALSGMNVSYRRPVLGEIHESFRQGFYEAFANDELKRRGYPLYLEPSALVFLVKDHRFGETFRGYFHLARTFAARRVAGHTRMKRLAFALGSSMLPFVLPARVALRTIRKNRYLLQLLRSLPHLIALTSSWSCGEFVGYLLGEGQSARRWT